MANGDQPELTCVPMSADERDLWQSSGMLIGSRQLYISTMRNDNGERPSFSAILTGEGGLVGFIKRDSAEDQRYLILESAWTSGEVGIGYRRIVAAIRGECQ